MKLFQNYFLEQVTYRITKEYIGIFLFKIFI